MADARLFQALSDGTRLNILSLLAGGSMNVSGMVARLKCAQPAVSRHLRVLRDVDLIRDTRKGKEVEYALNSGMLDEAAGFLEKLAGRAEPSQVAGTGRGTQPSMRRGEDQGKQVGTHRGTRRSGRRGAGQAERRKQRGSHEPAVEQGTRDTLREPSEVSRFVVKQKAPKMDDFLL